ncbi:MAG: M28 family peptidase [Lachnospiraceae bacterium]
MEISRTNPVLGYRTAGSPAEIATGDMLAEEMKKIGFSKVWKDAICVDAWEFKKAELTYTDRSGQERCVQLGAYQTNFITEKPTCYSLVYAGKGTEADYKNLDVTGKLVLVDINQRDEWWINYPVYQAYLKGAAALIAVQTGGYGEVDDAALNAQDIAGPPEAPAFSISRRDAEELKKLLQGKPAVPVVLDAYTRVDKNRTTYNIIGEITGRNTERKIMLSAHYDSYFDGFQDDNTAVSMMLGIGKALVETGWQPENTILFCAMASEEWGVADSQFDWSTGAYEQVFTVHPEWRGKVIADLNFELPALAHGTRARIRSTYEYVDFLEDFLEELPELTQGYPEETRITAPIETWSDDFSIAIAGIPSMVNDFTGGSFMETHYHSQFDNDNYYDADVYRMHHELFGLLLMAIDRTSVVPLNFAPVFRKAEEALDMDWCVETGADGEGLKKVLEQAAEQAEKVYEKVKIINRGKQTDANTAKLEECLLALFQKVQDTFVRIDWYGNVLFPHESLQQSLELLSGAADSLAEGNLRTAMRKIYEIDNNRYAFMFEEKVYQHFTEYVFSQPKERLKWGCGRIVGYVNLFGTVKSLLRKREEDVADYAAETAFLQEAAARQRMIYRDMIEGLKISVEEMKQMLGECLL